MEELLNGIKGLEQIDKTQFPEQAEPTVHEKLSRAGIEDNYSYENREIFQEGREKTDLINKPESFVAEGKTKISREETPEFKKANEWAETYLSDKVVDKYALSYVKNKKSPEEKRKNKKYDRWLGIANNELKPKLVELLEQKIKNKAIDKKESDSNKIKNEIAKILNSEMHATLLLRVFKSFEDEKNKSQNEESKPEDLFSDSNLGTGVEITLEPASESVMEPGFEEEKEDIKLENGALESPKTEKDFFKKFEQFGSYFNPIDNSEFQILGYDPEKKEVAIYRHQSFVYDKETDSWGTPEARGKEEVLKYEDFLKLAEGHISDLELNNKHFEEDKIELEKEKTKERKILGGFYANDNGDYFRQKEYLKNKGDKKASSKEGEVLFEVDPKIKKETKKFKISQLKDMIDKGRFNFFQKEEDLLRAFEKEFGKVDDERVQILDFKYRPEKGQYLAQIKENGQEPRLVSIKELREIIRNLSAEKPEEKLENDMEKLSELEEKLVDIFRREVLEYEKKAEQWVKEIFSEELWDVNKKDLIIKWINNTLSGLIKEALEKNNIKDASVEKVVNNLKSEIKPEDELAEKIKNDIKSFLEKF